MRTFILTLVLVSLSAVLPAQSQAICRATATYSQALLQYNQSIDHALIIHNERLAAAQAAFDSQIRMNSERLEAARMAVQEGMPGSTEALNQAILAYNLAQQTAADTFAAEARSASQDYNTVTLGAMDSYKRSLCLR